MYIMYKCCNCQKNFTRKINLKYHIDHRVCEKKQKITLKLKDANNTTNYENMTKQELLNEIIHLNGKNKALKENPRMVTNNNNQINIVVPPAFLSLDNYEHMIQQLPNLLHMALSKHPANFISYLIKETNCNPQRPIYNSIKLTNQKSTLLQVSNGQQYIYASKKKTIDELIQNKRDILQEYVDQNGEKYGKQILNRYEKYIEALDSDKNI